MFITWKKNPGRLCCDIILALAEICRNDGRPPRFVARGRLGRVGPVGDGQMDVNEINQKLDLSRQAPDFIVNIDVKRGR